MIKDRLKDLAGHSSEYESRNENLLRLAVRCIPPGRPRNLLDVGCGEGLLALRLARQLGIRSDHVHGLDFHEPYVRRCGETFNVMVVNLESGHLPYGDETFDVVVCNQVLEHLKNYYPLIRDMIRITKPDGSVIIGIPNLAHLINRIYLLFGRQPLCLGIDSSHVRGFAHSAFHRLLSSMPEIAAVECIGSELIYPLPLPLAKPLSKKWAGLSAYMCYLMRKRGPGACPH